MSERKVNQDQRLTENTLSGNKQSDLETEYIHLFKDGERADFIEYIQLKGPRAGPRSPTDNRAGASRLACFIFEVQVPTLLLGILSKTGDIYIVQNGGSKTADDRRSFFNSE